jgi:oxygen-independent coproporphyrinogen-3 oxidase
MSGRPPEQDKAETRPSLGLYVHVPFCASTCDFCAFYQTQPTAALVHEFLDDVARECDLVVWDAPVTTVFWGGGTPGLLAPRDLSRLAAIVRGRFGRTPREWTVELAPAFVTEARLAALREAGVTRVSMGVQSFQPALLEALGRKHTVAQVHRAYERLRAAGFASVNLDLMFALPGQTADEWSDDVRAAMALAPDHISTYCLTFEEDTALWVKLSQGRVKLDPEHEARLYEMTWSQLAAEGYAQYEVSNFARPGHECLHNLNTWRMHEWIGLGPSAASQHRGWRGTNVADLAKWSAGVAAGQRATQDRVAVTPALRAEDALIFGLRMNAGVGLGELRRYAPEAPWPVVDDTLKTLEAGGFLRRAGDCVRLTDRGRLVADSVGTEIMAAFEPKVETA